MAAVAAALIGASGQAASGIGGIIDASGKAINTGLQRAQDLDIARANYQYQGLLQQQQEAQYYATLAFQRELFDKQFQQQVAYRNSNLSLAQQAAREAGVPLWMVLDGSVPNVRTQILGSNFVTTPAGANPFTYKNFVPAASALAPPSSRITTGGDERYFGAPQTLRVEPFGPTSQHGKQLYRQAYDDQQAHSGVFIP
jgi:hypothetical protein